MCVHGVNIEVVEKVTNDDRIKADFPSPKFRSMKIVLNRLRCLYTVKEVIRGLGDVFFTLLFSFHLTVKNSLQNF